MSRPQAPRHAHLGDRSACRAGQEATRSEAGEYHPSTGRPDALAGGQRGSWTVAPFAPSGDPSGPSKLSVMAHALVYVLGVAILMRVALWFGYLEGANEIMTWVLMIVFGASVWHQLRPGLCLRCMKEVPLDGPVRAETQRSLLKLAHFNGSWKSVIVTVALVIVGPIIVQLLVNGEHTSLSSVPSDLWIFALIYSNWLHHRLRPWCPYCRDWDDDGDPEPSPDPTTFGTKTVH